MTEEEYKFCINKNSDALYRFVCKQLRDSDKGRDVVQEACLRLWENHGNLLIEKGKPYLFTTAYRLIVDLARKYKMQNQYNENYSGDKICFNGYSEEKEHLEYTINLLPPVQKTVLLLRDLEGYTYEEIGEITQLSEAQVKTYIFRARLFLKQQLGTSKK